MEFIKELAKLGFFIDPSVVNRINQLTSEEFRRVLEELEKENMIVLSEDFFNRYFKPTPNLLNKFEERRKFSMQDIVNILNNRYDFLQKILIKKTDLTNLLSINKIGLGKVSVIGFVKEKAERGDNYLLTIEDPTGEVQVVATKNISEKIDLDDVVAVAGNVNNKIFFVEKILFPDVPLREANYTKTPIKIAFTEKNVEADYVINKNKIIDLEKNKTEEFIDPVILEIGGVVILVVLDADPLDVLKKRFVHKENNDFLIDPTPDIVFNNKNVNMNYKGITILPENILVNLSNRETSFL